MAQIPKRKLSIFSFGSNSSSSGGGSGNSSNGTAPGSTSASSTVAANTANSTMLKPDQKLSVGSRGAAAISGNTTGGNPGSATTSKLSIPHNSSSHPNVSSPTDSSMSEDLNIFERSVQDSIPPFEKINSRRPTLTRLRSNSKSTGEFGSQASLTNFKNEDFIPPALDATTSILNDSNTNLDDVDIIYSSRRNSSVIGLNMALGRSAPSRKNSVYSMSQLHQQNSPNLNLQPFSPQSSGSSSHFPSLSSSSGASKPNKPTIPIPESMGKSRSNNHPISPTSPPKLTSSKSSISFYSYADLLSNDEYTKRPSFKKSYSQGIIPTRKNSMASNKTAANGNAPSGLSKKFNSNLNKFLISPESSDSEDDIQSRNKSIGDNESLISSSIGDCLRQTSTELSGN